MRNLQSQLKAKKTYKDYNQKSINIISRCCFIHDGIIIFIIISSAENSPRHAIHFNARFKQKVHYNAVQSSNLMYITLFLLTHIGAITEGSGGNVRSTKDQDNLNANSVL